MKNACSQNLFDSKLKRDWFICFVSFRSQATLGMKGVKEMKALLDILELDSSVYVRIQVRFTRALYLY